MKELQIVSHTNHELQLAKERRLGGRAVFEQAIVRKQEMMKRNDSCGSEVWNLVSKQNKNKKL